MMHGKGIFTWEDGRKYTGSYYYNKKHGFGDFLMLNKDRYIGNWENGQMHGKGTMYFEAGEHK